MDSRDSSSSSSSMHVTSRDALDDDESMSVVNALAKEAGYLFQAEKFVDCLKVLHQLSLMKADDPKILHNIAITDSFRDDFLHPKRFLEEMLRIKKRIEEVANSSGEIVESGSNTGNKAVIGTKGASSSANQVSTNDTSLPRIYLDEYDVSVLMFNIALIWYHLHNYEKSFSILESLYQNIELIDERVACHICILLLDVALVCRHLPRAADVIIYIERVFIGNSLVSQADLASSAQPQSAILARQSSSVSTNVLPDAAANADSTANANGLESPLTDDNLLETFMSNLDISGQRVSRTSDERSRSQWNESVIAADKLLLYKVWLLILARNLKAAKREVKMAMNVVVHGNDDHYMALFLKSQLEYARGNNRKAIRLLDALTNRTEKGLTSLYNNNLGCIYYQLGKYHTSIALFHKALDESASLKKEKPVKLLNFSRDKSAFMFYNLGILHMAVGKPLLAARYFYKARLVFDRRPLFWLRMAECCLTALANKSEIEVHVIGKGKWRHLVIGNGQSRRGEVEDYRKQLIFSSDDQQHPSLSMLFARQCLNNALLLVDRHRSKTESPSHLASEETESKEMVLVLAKSTSSKASNLAVGLGQVNSNGEVKEQKVGNSLIQSSIIEYKGICAKSNQMIEQAVLADLAFVELELGNYLKALSTARSLLNLPECSRVFSFLGNLYASEALCLLNRLKEASEHLLVYLSSENNVEYPYSQNDLELLKAEKPADYEEPSGGGRNGTGPNVSSSSESQSTLFLGPEEARGTIWANLAVVAALRGDIDGAHQLADLAMSALPNSTDAYLTAIYVDLKRGNKEEAIAKLKRCSHVRFLPCTLKSKSSS